MVHATLSKNLKAKFSGVKRFTTPMAAMMTVSSTMQMRARRFAQGLPISFFLSVMMTNGMSSAARLTSMAPSVNKPPSVFS